MTQAKTRYLENRHNGKTYETMEEAIEAGAMANARIQYPSTLEMVLKFSPNISASIVAQELYNLKKRVIIEKISTENNTSNDPFAGIEL